MKQHLLRHGACAVALGLSMLAAPQASAAPRTNFVYSATDKKLADVLQDFAASQGASAIVDKAIDERVSVSFNQPADEVLKRLTLPYGLSYHRSGRTIYFYRTADVETRMLKIQRVDLDRLQASLKRMGIEDPRFPLQLDDVEKTVYIKGPRQYVEAMATAIASLDQEPSSTPSEGQELRIFRLRYAWAQDKTVDIGGETIVQPGVATVLKRLFQDAAQPPASNRGTAGPEPHKPKILSNRTVHSAVAGSFEVPMSMDQMLQRYDAARESAMSSRRSGRAPSIEADNQNNAVIVRDDPRHMAWYERVVAMLDTRPVRIEIEAKIIDVEASSMEQLGVEWVAFGRRAIGGFDGGSARAGGGSITTLVGGRRQGLLARIDALAEEGKARVVAQPKVLTLNNIEANLANTDTFHVRVAGNQSAELYSVTAGTRLRVTPLLAVEDDGNRSVKLAVAAQDGNLSGTSVDGLPVVQGRNIDTQAFVREGESLLIGGLVFERETSHQTAVPGLSKLPLIGAVFRSNRQTRQRVERLFLITPRVVDDKAADPPPTGLAPSPAAPAASSTVQPQPGAPPSPRDAIEQGARHDQVEGSQWPQRGC